MPTGDPCSCCGGMPCRGTWIPVVDWPETAPIRTWTAATVTTTWPPENRLHPDDIEKIAQRVVELLEKK